MERATAMCPDEIMGIRAKQEACGVRPDTRRCKRGGRLDLHDSSNLGNCEPVDDGGDVVLVSHSVTSVY